MKAVQNRACLQFQAIDPLAVYRSNASPKDSEWTELICQLCRYLPTTAAPSVDCCRYAAEKTRIIPLLRLIDNAGSIGTYNQQLLFLDLDSMLLV